MLINVLNGFIDGSSKFDFANGGIIAFVSILVVFAILLIVITITHYLFKGIDKVSSKVITKVKESEKAIVPAKREPVVIKDDDMMAAVLIATIDYQNEIKKGVRVVSVKEIN